MIIKRLPAAEFPRLQPIFENEFDSDAPLPDNSEIFVVYEEGKMIGFVLAEQIRLLGQIYVIPSQRKAGAKIVKALLDHCKDNYVGKEVIGAVASEPRFGNLYKAYKMQKIEGEFYRRNID